MKISNLPTVANNQHVSLAAAVHLVKFSVEKCAYLCISVTALIRVENTGMERRWKVIVRNGKILYDSENVQVKILFIEADIFNDKDG